MITVRKGEGGEYQVIAGASRMRLQIALRGTVSLVDRETHEQLTVHETGGKLLVVTQRRASALDRAATAVFDAARRCQ